MGLIKRQVEKGVTESCRESHKDWMEKAEQTLAEQPPGSPHSSKPPSPEQSVTQQQVCLLRAKELPPWDCLSLTPASVSLCAAWIVHYSAVQKISMLCKIRMLLMTGLMLL